VGPAFSVGGELDAAVEEPPLQTLSSHFGINPEGLLFRHPSPVPGYKGNIPVKKKDLIPGGTLRVFPQGLPVLAGLFLQLGLGELQADHPAAFTAGPALSGHRAVLALKLSKILPEKDI